VESDRSAFEAPSLVRNAAIVVVIVIFDRAKYFSGILRAFRFYLTIPEKRNGWCSGKAGGGRDLDGLFVPASPEPFRSQPAILN